MNRSQLKIISTFSVALAVGAGILLSAQCAPAKPIKAKVGESPSPQPNSKPVKTPATQPQSLGGKDAIAPKNSSQLLYQELQAVMPNASVSQQRVLAKIGEKSGTITAPLPPADDLLQWQSQRWREVVPQTQMARGKNKIASASATPVPTVVPKADAKNLALQGLLGEDLTIAQNLLADADPQQQRRGLRVARDAAIKAAARIGDKELVAQIFDGFIVPYIEVASTGAGLLSRQRLLQDAASAYNAAGQREKEAAVLGLLVRVAQQEQDNGRADRARLKLAAALMSLERYAEAKDSILSVSSPDMTAGRALLPTIEKKLEAQRQAKAQKEDAIP